MCRDVVSLIADVCVPLFCMCLLSQVFVFDLDILGRGQQGTEQKQFLTWCVIFTWQGPLAPEGGCWSSFHSAACCSRLWQRVSALIYTLALSSSNKTLSFMSILTQSAFYAVISAVISGSPAADFKELCSFKGMI